MRARELSSSFSGLILCIAAQLPRVTVNADDVAVRDNEKPACAVCKDEFSIGDGALRLPCAHLYHEDCVVQWLKNTGTCPICRKVVEQPASEKAAADAAGASK